MQYSISVEELLTPAADSIYEFPCSTVERVCWYLDRLSPGSAKFNIAVRFLLRGPLQAELLHKALIGVAERHEILRTNFVEREGEPKQVVHPRPNLQLSVEDLRTMPEAERRPEAEARSVSEAMIGFDLTQGSLVRSRLLILEDEEAMLLMTIHHIIADGWSVGLITDEMGRIYESLIEGTEPELPELAIQYADYSVWQKEWHESEEYKSKFGELKGMLDGFEAMVLPPDKERPSVPQNRGEIRSILLPRALTHAVKQFNERHAFTMFMTMVSACCVLMWKETGSKEVTLRTQVAGRDRLELEPLIGWFVNTVILRIQTDENLTFLQLVEEVQKVALKTLEYQDVPFEHLIENLDVKRKDTRAPQLPVNFILQRDFVRPWRRAGLSLVPIPSKAAGAFVDLILFLVEREDGWRVSVDVNTDVLLPETGEFFLANFRTILESVVENPEVRISSIPMKKRKLAYIAPTRDSEDESLHSFVPPRSAVEEDIARIWERVLNRRPVGAYSNFFDLGGHSLTAVGILAEIRTRYGRDIKIPELFVDPTPAAMARVISGEEVHSDPREIIPIQPHGSYPQVFLIGGDHWFRPLATNLGMDIPLLGVPLNKYRHLDMDKDRPLAAKALAESLMKQYEGQTFYLAGWCADGMTAYEIGKQMVSMGGNVGLVVLFDAVNPEYYRELRGLVHSTGRTFQSLKSIWKASMEGGVTEALPRFARSLGGVAHRIATRAGELLGTTYNAAPVEFPLLVVRPPMTALEKPDLGWSRVSPNVRVLEVPGDHSSIFKDPFVATLGARLRVELLRFMGSSGRKEP